MPCRVEWYDNHFRHIAEGVVDFSEITRANEIIMMDPRADLCAFGIFDGLNLNGFDLSTSDIQTIAEVDSANSLWKSHIKIGLVATDDQVLDAFIKYYAYSRASHREMAWEIKIFSTVEEAIAWGES